MPFFGGGGGDYHIIATNIKGGTDAAPSVTGSNNMALGNGALQNSTLCDFNIAIGNNAGNSLADGGYNVIIGGNAGNALQQSSDTNIIIGYQAAFNSPASSRGNVIIGTGAYNNVALSVDNCVILGVNAQNLSGANNSVTIGANANSGNNSIAIKGVAGDDAIVIGSVAQTSIFIGGIDFSAGPGTPPAGNDTEIQFNSGGAFGTDPLFTYNTGVLSTPSAIIGDAGTEETGINIGGVNYDALFKVSDITGADIAQSIIHRHSTTWEPIQVFARSNSNGSGHGAVTNGMLISSQYSAGWTGTEYNLFGRAGFEAAAVGAISDASSPGDFVIATTPAGAVLPVEAVRVGSTKAISFNGNPGAAGQVLVSSGPNAAPLWKSAAAAAGWTRTRPFNYRVSGTYENFIMSVPIPANNVVTNFPLSTTASFPGVAVVPASATSALMQFDLKVCAGGLAGTHELNLAIYSDAAGANHFKNIAVTAYEPAGVAAGTWIGGFQLQFEVPITGANGQITFKLQELVQGGAVVNADTSIQGLQVCGYFES